ncbi:MAG: alpha/beta fold hydrolase [Xanthomonadales bacterium]|nr:alpha/beta fold hydrolase [Xanthomonadales bacterium]
MIEIVLFGGLGLAAVWVVLILTVPARCGQFVYDVLTGLESRIYGLKQIQVDIGEMKISLYQNEFSDRATIMMLHGFSADKDVWIRFARHFTDDFNVVIPDLAGHGDTGFEPSWDYTMPAQASRVAKIIEQLKIEKIHVIGNSMGGFISAHFARLFPRQTLSVTLVDPAGVVSPEASDMDKMLLEERNPFLIHNRQEFDSFYAMTMANPPYVPDLVLEAVFAKYQQRREQLGHIFGHVRERDLLGSSLNEINGPVLLLWGEEDRLIHVSAADIWATGIKDTQVKVWPGIGHMPMLEIPMESAEVYRQFIDQIE